MTFQDQGTIGTPFEQDYSRYAVAEESFAVACVLLVVDEGRVGLHQRPTIQHLMIGLCPAERRQMPNGQLAIFPDSARQAATNKWNIDLCEIGEFLILHHSNPTDDS